MSIKAKAIVACTDAETTHHSWLKFHVLVYKVVIQNGVLMVAMKTSASARFQMEMLLTVCISEYQLTT